MNINDIGDEEFVPFLQSLGVDTYKKSFEWMLNDPDFAGVLRWLYNNLDTNNALNTREEYRYAEMEKCNQVPTPEELESTIVSIQQEFEGLSLPGDHETLEDIKMDISMQKERLSLLEKQEAVLKDLIRQNILSKEELTFTTTKLNSAIQQSVEDETTASEECLALAAEVEEVTEDVVDIIADTLDTYANCHTDKETASKFFIFGPLDSYRQSQALFRSHFDLYVTKYFSKNQNESTTDLGLRSALIEAKNMEERLSDALSEYIESKAELAGEYAKLALVTNYTNVHPSQITSCMMEAQSALELLEQEESILDQELQAGIKELVEERTRLAFETSANAALAVREQLQKDITLLHDTAQLALALDKLVYCALRHELRAAEELLQFSAHLNLYLAEEREAVASRVESMNEICIKQDLVMSKLQNSDPLLESLFTILGATKSGDAMLLMKLYHDVRSAAKEAAEEIQEEYRSKERRIVEFKNSTKLLKKYIWDGCTKQPNCWDRTVAALTHSLREQLDKVDRRVLDASGFFTSVKNGDKRGLRKLWQWFLTDQGRLLTTVRAGQTRSYS